MGKAESQKRFFGDALFPQNDKRRLELTRRINASESIIKIITT